MEVSRTSPQGLFANLKSLFVGRQPLYVPDVELKIFEACCDLFKNLGNYSGRPER